MFESQVNNYPDEKHKELN